MDLGMSWLLGNAEDLVDIEDDSFDAYTIAFCIRNCTHIDKVSEHCINMLPTARIQSNYAWRLTLMNSL